MIVQKTSVIGLIFKLLTVVVIILGIMALVDIISSYSRKSYVIGTLEYKTVEEVDVFNCNLGTVVFNKDGAYYVYENTFNGVEFDGKKQNYSLKFNEFECSAVTLESGFIYGERVLDFFSVKGTLASTTVVKVKITFLSGKTKLHLSTNSDRTAMGYLMTYLSENGLQIKVAEVNQIDK